jgi:hypothetical protein
MEQLGDRKRLAVLLGAILLTALFSRIDRAAAHDEHGPYAAGKGGFIDKTGRLVAKLKTAVRSGAI